MPKAINLLGPAEEARLANPSTLLTNLGPAKTAQYLPTDVSDECAHGTCQ